MAEEEKDMVGNIKEVADELSNPCPSTLHVSAAPDLTPHSQSGPTTPSNAIAGAYP